MSEMTIQRLEELRGAPVCDSTGEKIGKVEEIFYDQDTDRPEWLGIGTGFFGTKRVLVPLAGAKVDADSVTVAYDKNLVKDSPDIDSDEISEQTARDLYAYYGVGAGAPAGTATQESGSGAQETGTVTRSEEELQVGKREVDAGSVRLKKWVETEPVQADVELKSERARVTRETIDEPVGEAAFGEDEVEVPLRAEQPVVAKQTVAKERIGVEKDVTTETETVSDDVRKERVEVEGDATEDR